MGALYSQIPQDTDRNCTSNRMYYKSVIGIQILKIQIIENAWLGLVVIKYEVKGNGSVINSPLLV